MAAEAAAGTPAPPLTSTTPTTSGTDAPASPALLPTTPTTRQGPVAPFTPRTDVTTTERLDATTRATRTAATAGQRFALRTPFSTTKSARRATSTGDSRRSRPDRSRPRPRPRRRRLPTATTKPARQASPFDALRHATLPAPTTRITVLRVAYGTTVTMSSGLGWFEEWLTCLCQAWLKKARDNIFGTNQKGADFYKGRAEKVPVPDARPWCAAANERPDGGGAD